MNKILETLINRPLVILCALVYFIMAGMMAYVTIPKEQEPDLDMGVVMVSVTLEGVSPVDAERLLARPLEEQFSEIDGLDEMTSSSFQGGVRVTLEFDLGVDMDVALQEVRTKIDMARPEMPQDIKEPRA